MGKLTTSERKALPTKDFAGPGRSYPIPDANHARDALAMVKKYGSQALQKKVRSLVHHKFPQVHQAAHAMGHYGGKARK